MQCDLLSARECDVRVQRELSKAIFEREVAHRDVPLVFGKPRRLRQVPSTIWEHQNQLVETARNPIRLISDGRGETIRIVILVANGHRDSKVRRWSATNPRIRGDRSQFYSIRLQRDKIRVRVTSRPSTLSDSLEVIACVTAGGAHLR